MQNQHTETLAFLYTNNENSEREIKESIPFIIATKRIKCLGISLPKETKELYTENYKINSKREFAVWLRKLKQGLCISLEGWGGEGDSKGRGYMYTYG